MQGCICLSQGTLHSPNSPSNLILMASSSLENTCKLVTQQTRCILPALPFSHLAALLSEKNDSLKMDEIQAPRQALFKQSCRESPKHQCTVVSH